MDGGHGVDRKRRASPAAAAPGATELAPPVSHKKPRGRDGEQRRESEFVSVEVGMRELRKRLATVDSGAQATTTPARRSAAKTSKGGTAKASPPPSATRHSESIATRSTATLHAVKDSSSRAARAKRSTPRKEAAKKRAQSTAAGKRPTLAEVREQAQRDQQMRVEARVQQLKRAAKSSAGADEDVPKGGANSTVPTASSGAAASPFASPTDSTVCAVASRGDTDAPTQQEAIAGGVRSDGVPSASQEPNRDEIASTKPPSGTYCESSNTAVSNKFIGDDADEDMIFLMALEEVESKLAPSTAPSITPVVPVPTEGEVRRTLEQASSKEARVEPQQAQLDQAAPSTISSDDVLREFERLKRENEELRKSNERLQAAATAQAPLKVPDSAVATDTLAPSDPLPCITAAPTDAVVVQQTQHSLDCSEGGAGDGDNCGTGEATAPDEFDSEQARALTRSPSPNRQQPLADRTASNTSTEPGASPSRDTSTVSVLDLSPLPTDTVPRRVAPTPSSIAATKAKMLSEMDEQNTALGHDNDARESNGLESERNETSSPSQPLSRGGASNDEHARFEEEEEDEEEERHGTQRVTIDFGNDDEYKQEQHEEEDDDQAGCDETVSDVKGVEALESPTVRMEDVAESFRTPGSGVDLTTRNDEPINNATRMEEEEEDATTSLPSEPLSSVEVEDDDESFMTAKKIRRPAAIESSSSESEDSSDAESEDMEDSGGAAGSGSAKNALEAALQAAASTAGVKKKFVPLSPAARPTTVAPSSIDATDISVTKTKLSQKRPAPAPASSTATLGSAPASTKKRARSDSTSLSSNAAAIAKSKSTVSSSAAARSTLLWPALDDFYDFLLNLSPSHVGGGGGQRQDWSSSSPSSLRQFAGRKLPAQYESIEQYCTTQLDAITEELLASIGNSRGGGSGHSKAFYLTSVSQCNPSLHANAQIFSESGFTGTARSANDFVLTFRPLPPPRGQDSGTRRFSGGSLDLMNGDLISLRSPQWKSFELFVYGVTLCTSIVSDTGSSGGSNTGSMVGDGSDEVCVLVRVQQHPQRGEGASGMKALLDSFSTLTELCLSNQRAAKWSWSIQHAHNTTTSAREYQAIKSTAFFSPGLRKVLLDGILPAKNAEEKDEDDRAADVLSPELRKRLERQYNSSQMRAIVGCLGEEKIVMIQGPPGTGKTKTVLGLLSALLDGAGLSTLRKGTARIRVGASLQGGGSGKGGGGNGPRNNSVRVLVAAPSNAAVDELVVRMVSEGLVDGSTGQSYRPRMVRVGRPESVGGGDNGGRFHLSSEREASAAKKTRGKMRKYAAEVESILLETQVARQKASFGTARAARQAIVRGAQVVFCTLSGAGSVALCDFAHEFDALVIDEAAQAVEASALIPFKFRPHRTILVGDHRQLPATVLSKRLVAIGYDRSLFQRLVERGSRVRLLTRQYRMHPGIARFPSAYFYDGKLVQDAQLARSRARAFHAREPFRPFAFIDVAGGAQSQVSGSTSLRNLSEVELVVLLVRALVRQFPQLEWKKAIGVIAPYKQQILELGARLAQLERELGARLAIEVNTVDGFQGREKDVIIYSCVRTSAGGRGRGGKHKAKRRGAGDGSADAFWADERRMNVAITRARASLWILGNSRLLEQSAAWRALLRDARSHRAYFGDEQAKELLLLPSPSPSPPRPSATGRRGAKGGAKGSA